MWPASTRIFDVKDSYIYFEIYENVDNVYFT